MRRQRRQPRALVDERVGDETAVRIDGHGACVRDAFDPVGELRVEVVDRGEPARREERVAQVLDGALDLALLVAAC
jgi:hypothetical protein